MSVRLVARALRNSVERRTRRGWHSLRVTALYMLFTDPYMLAATPLEKTTLRRPPHHSTPLPFSLSLSAIFFIQLWRVAFFTRFGPILVCFSGEATLFFLKGKWPFFKRLALMSRQRFVPNFFFSLFQFRFVFARLWEIDAIAQPWGCYLCNIFLFTCR